MYFKNFIRINTIEIISFVYLILTAVYILCFYGRITGAGSLLINRLIIAAITLLLVLGSGYKIVHFLRFAFPLALTAYWYPETYYLNYDVIIPNLDGFFDGLDKTIFACAPSMVFSEMWPQAWVSEAMYFGYFSYYFVFAFIGIYLYFFNKAIVEREMFIIISAFLIFYIIFIFVPVMGPQFYYPAQQTSVPDGYFFCNLMRGIQASGEKPTGAFPSSHVGMTIIYMYIMFKHVRKAFWIYLPAAVVLAASTVYIKAHYLIDVFGAFLFTPIIYIASKKLYAVLRKR